MGYGTGIALIVIGLVLALAFNVDIAGPLALDTLGWILVLAGVLVVVVVAVQSSTRRRHTVVQETVHRDGSRSVHERHESDPPPPPAV